MLKSEKTCENKVIQENIVSRKLKFIRPCGYQRQHFSTKMQTDFTRICFLEQISRMATRWAAKMLESGIPFGIFRRANTEEIVDGTNNKKANSFGLTGEY
jgi:hypothetical protein